MNERDLALVLALADDELCVGQNLAWWIAVGPFLEEDLALVSIAQDELGHARALYELLAPVSSYGSVDELAYARSPADYRSSHLAELPCHSWDEALVRHTLYDFAERQRWMAFADSDWAELAAVARRALIEERSHIHHATSLCLRLLDSALGRERLAGLFRRLAPLADGLFDPARPVGAAFGDNGATDNGATDGKPMTLGAPLEAQRASWRDDVDALLAPAQLGIDWPEPAATEPAATTEPGRHGVRSDHFAALHHEMVEVLEIDPQARW